MPRLVWGDPLNTSVQLEIRQGRPVVNGVYVNGHGPYRFLLDTGSTLNHLESGLVEATGLTPTFHTDLRSSTGVIHVSGSGGVSVTLNSIRATGQTFLFAGLDAVHEVSSDIQGILGQEFLSHFDYMIDVRAKRLTFGKSQIMASGTRVPFRNVEGRPVVATSLGGLVLDSGSARVVRFGTEAKEMTHVMTTVSGQIRVGTVFSKLLIDGTSFWRGEAVAVPKVGDPGTAGLMPLSLFKVIYVSNSEGYVILV